MIKCSICDTTKPVTEFYSSERSRRIPRCKICLIAKSAEYQKTNREHVNRKNLHYAEKHPDRQQLYYRRYRDKNKTRIKEMAKQRRLAIKEETFAVYSLNAMACACCSEHRIEFLSLDHTNGGGNEERRKLKAKHISGGTKFYAYLKRNGYPSGYRVLCHNCNLSLGFFNYCPHVHNKD